MAGTFSRSWQLVQETWRVLGKDKELLVFPVVSGIAVIIIIASFSLPLLFSGLLRSGFGIVTWVLLIFVFYFVTLLRGHLLQHRPDRCRPYPALRR